jgi:HprK-related kinase A
MARLGDLALDTLERRCAGAGQVFDVGPFSVRFRTRMAGVVPIFHRLYRDFPALEDEAILDFTFALEKRAPSRPWSEARANFTVDGYGYIEPFPRRFAWPDFEWGINFAIAQSGLHRLMFHGAALEKGGRAVLLPGVPGAGKSTLSAGLMLRGWRLLSDEFIIVAAGGARLLPLPRPVSLKNQSIDIVRALSPALEFGPRIEGTHKGTLCHMQPRPGDVARMAEPAMPALIVFPTYTQGLRCEGEAMGRAEAFMRFAENAFNYRARGRAGFDELATMIASCRCMVMRHGELAAATEAIERWIAP